MRRETKVYFCIDCDDEPPWKAEDIVKCPSCHSSGGVKEAQRFQNLTSEQNGTVRRP